jgi:hypothetical protein
VAFSCLVLLVAWTSDAPGAARPAASAPATAPAADPAAPADQGKGNDRIGIVLRNPYPAAPQR